MASKGTKIALIILGVVLVIAIAFVVLLWYLGVFATPELEVAEKGPYQYVYIDRTGPFTEVPMGQQQVDSLVNQQNIEVGIACWPYLNDPAQITQQNLKWRVGYIVADSVDVAEPLQFMTIARDQYLVVSIKANPMVAIVKTSPAIHEWLAANPYDAIQDREAYALYKDNGVIEVLFPVHKRTD
ncbi:MAG: GyrI-like domain-containing protein [Calditrichaceae bacterium]